MIAVIDSIQSFRGIFKTMINSLSHAASESTLVFYSSSAELGTRYLKSSSAAAIWQKKQRQRRLSLLK